MTTRLTSVANAARLLQSFTMDIPERGISELAKCLGLAKSTVHRLASTLVKTGLLEQNTQTFKYRLGLEVFKLGACVASQMDVSTQSVPYLKQLMEKTEETVHLAILDQKEVLYINKIESRQTFRMYSRLGRRAPLDCTGVGKVLLAFQSAEKIEQIIAGGLTPYTDHTLTDTDELRRHLEEIRMLGYAIDDEEIEMGLRCIAAPIRDHSSNVIASISIAGPTQRITKKRLISFAQEIICTAENISQRLGFSRSHQVIPLPLALKGT